MVERDELCRFARLKDEIYWIAAEKIKENFSSPEQKWKSILTNNSEVHEMLRIFNIINITLETYCMYMHKKNIYIINAYYQKDLKYLIEYVGEEKLDEYKKKFIYDENFFGYIFILKEIISEAILAGYAEGMTYLEFFDRLSEEYGISMSGETKDSLYNTFKNQISKCNEGKEDFIRNIGSIWLTHKGIEGKNKNGGEVLVPSIMLYEKAEYEFEFLMRRQYKTKDDEMTRVKEELEKVRKQKLEIILKEVFGDEEIDFKTYCKQYVSLLAKPIVEMSDNELKVYLKYMKCKRNFIKKYSSPEFRNIGMFRLYYELDYEKEWLCLFQNLNLNNMDFFALSNCVSRFIEVFSEDIRKSWKEAIKFLNYICKIFGLFEKSCYIEEYGDQILKVDENLYMYRKRCESTRRFNKKGNIKVLEERFVKKFDTVDGLSDFINIIILEEAIIVGIDDEDDKREYWIPTQEYISFLAQGMSSICFFLNKCCVKATEAIGDEFDIKEEFRGLLQDLKSKGINLATEDLTQSYINKNKKTKTKSYKKYFKECDETKYIRLFLMIKKELQEKGKLPDEPNIFIQNYMDSIFNRRTPEEQKIQEEYVKSEKVSEMILANLACCMNDSFIFYDYENIYNLKKEIGKILDKYDLQDIC